MQEEPEGRRVGDEYRLALFLSAPGAYREPVLRVVPVWVRPSRQSHRHSGWVAPRIIEAASDLVPVPEGGWPAAQEEALTLLLHGPQESTLISGQMRRAAVIDQPLQGRALWNLLEGDEPHCCSMKSRRAPFLNWALPGSWRLAGRRMKRGYSIWRWIRSQKDCSRKRRLCCVVGASCATWTLSRACSAAWPVVPSGLKGWRRRRRYPPR